MKVIEIKKYFPAMHEKLLAPDYCGTRTRLNKNHNLADFSILFPSDHGLDGLVNLAGIESPGLTASLAISKFVAKSIL